MLGRKKRTKGETENNSFSVAVALLEGLSAKPRAILSCLSLLVSEAVAHFALTPPTIALLGHANLPSPSKAVATLFVAQN